MYSTIDIIYNFVNFYMHVNKFIKFFRKEYSVWVCGDKTVEFCPCRFKLKSVDFCNFPQFIVEPGLEKGSPKYNRFINLICMDLKHRVQGTDQRSLEIDHRLADAVKIWKMGTSNPAILFIVRMSAKMSFFLNIPREDFLTYIMKKVFSQS